MPEAAENYQPRELQQQFHRQAVRVWIIILAVAAVWVLITVSAPILAANSLETIAKPIYNFFGYICHQKPERSFHIAGYPLAVCSRCFGVYFGILLGVIVYPLWRRIDDIEPLPRFWLILAILPIAIDWSLGVFGIWENSHATRFITGMILGFACAVFVVPALVEIVRNLQRPARSKGDSY